jgi:hypothetical protein
MYLFGQPDEQNRTKCNTNCQVNEHIHWEMFLQVVGGLLASALRVLETLWGNAQRTLDTLLAGKKWRHFGHCCNKR